MPICGFNEKMLKGLAAFNEGLVEHGLLYRSDQNGESVEQGIKREISDMTRLIAELHRIDDASKRIITEGVVKYAMGFYLIMRKHDVHDYKAVIEEIGEYFRLMDEKYYSELEGRPEDMRELTEFLNDQPIQPETPLDSKRRA
tara:strand:+ start:604 stop:1032 length:429 start_codon:yes stop_codon:yes gene_type:complete